MAAISNLLHLIGHKEVPVFFAPLRLRASRRILASYQRAN